MFRSPFRPVLNGSADASSPIRRSDHLLKGGSDQVPAVLLQTLHAMLSVRVPFGTSPVLRPGLLLQWPPPIPLWHMCSGRLPYPRLVIGGASRKNPR